MAECFKGWATKDGNLGGRCCCNCKSQVEIRSHPWNMAVGGRMKGPVTSVAGWGCNTDLQGPGVGIIFFEREHGMCEMHTFKGVPK